MIFVCFVQESGVVRSRRHATLTTQIPVRRSTTDFLFMVQGSGVERRRRHATRTTRLYESHSTPNLVCMVQGSGGVRRRRHATQTTRLPVSRSAPSSLQQPHTAASILCYSLPPSSPYSLSCWDERCFPYLYEVPQIVQTVDLWEAQKQALSLIY
jgi:hypothetical protein